MDKYIASATPCLEHAEKLPKRLLKNCAGIVFLTAKEAGLVVAGIGGAGVLLAHSKDGTWSPPIAVKLTGTALGATIGAQEKEMVVVLGKRAAEKMVTSDFQIKFGVGAGFAVGKTGREWEAEVGSSESGGLGMSYVFTYSKGLMLSADIENTNLSEEPNVNLGVYHKATAKEIIEGPVTVPDDVKEFMAKVEALTAGEE